VLWPFRFWRQGTRAREGLRMRRPDLVVFPGWQRASSPVEVFEAGAHRCSKGHGFAVLTVAVLMSAAPGSRRSRVPAAGEFHAPVLGVFAWAGRSPRARGGLRAAVAYCFCSVMKSATRCHALLELAACTSSTGKCEAAAQLCLGGHSHRCRTRGVGKSGAAAWAESGVSVLRARGQRSLDLALNPASRDLLPSRGSRHDFKGGGECIPTPRRAGPVMRERGGGRRPGALSGGGGSIRRAIRSGASGHDEGHRGWR
jgi:hypothetical protein